MECIFCNIDKESIIKKNELAFAIKDKYPHSKGHVLIIPFRHYENYFDSRQNELEAFSDLLFKMKTYTDEKYKPVAYNVSVNAGKKAGQVIMHAHIHLIPRY